MRIPYLVILMAACILVGAFFAPAREAHTTTTYVVKFDRHDLRVMKELLWRTCALDVEEDGSGRWERDDDARAMCDEVVSQIGH